METCIERYSFGIEVVTRNGREFSGTYLRRPYGKYLGVCGDLRTGTRTHNVSKGLGHRAVVATAGEEPEMFRCLACF
jgi:hypothetical protein